jgi:hypothetical protein
MSRLMLVANGSMEQRGIIHKPVHVHLLLHRMIFLRCKIVHPILVKATLQPALHRVTTNMREWEARPGMIWACCAVAGRAGMPSIPCEWSARACHLGGGQRWA